MTLLSPRKPGGRTLEASPVVAIDPGPTQSAFVLFNGAIREGGKLDNDAMLIKLHDLCCVDQLVIEQVASFGMPVGAEVFETVFWSGRFAQQWQNYGCSWDRLTRLRVKMALCHDSRAKDSHIRQALIDRFGGSRGAAIGTKAAPGPLYGVSGDVWSALAVAVAWSDYCAASHDPARTEAP